MKRPYYREKVSNKFGRTGSGTENTIAMIGHQADTIQVHSPVAFYEKSLKSHIPPHRYGSLWWAPPAVEIVGVRNSQALPGSIGCGKNPTSIGLLGDHHLPAGDI